MINLSNHDILKLSSIHTFESGTQLYEQNIFPPRVITVSSNPENRNLRVFESVYRSPMGTYHLYMAIHNEEGIKAFYCDCKDGEKGGMCKHLVALALSIRNFYNIKETENLSSEDIKRLEEERLKKEQINALSKERRAELIRNQNIFRQLLTSYNELNPSIVTCKQINLIPTIDISKKKYLSLQIGFEKMYVVSDIVEFLFNVQNESFFEYGKNLAFYHTYESFSKKSQALIDLLSRVVNLDNYQYRNKKYIEINSSVFEDIIKIFKGENIKILSSSKSSEVLVMKEPLEIEILLDKNILTTNLEDGLLIKGYRNNYFLKQKCLYELSKLNKEIVPLFNFISTYGHLDMSDTLEDFLISIYPRIYKHIKISDEFSNEHPLYELRIDSYIDEEDGTIILNPKFYIGNKEKTLDDLSRETYNHAGFDAYYKYLNFLGFEQIGSVMEIIDPYKYISFLNVNLHDLKSFGEVYLSENFKSIQIKKMQNISLKASISVNMLSVCFKELGFSDQELYQIINAYRKKKKFIKLSGNVVVDLEDEKICELDRFIDDLKLDLHTLNETQRKPLYQILKLTDYRNCKIEFSEEIKKIIIAIKNYKNASYEIPPMLKDILRPYQVEAFKWLKTLSSFGLGGILADDMGLGKTLEMLALLLSDNEDKPSLIISPMSLVYNWQSEAKRFAPDLKTKVILGSIEERENIIGGIVLDEKGIYITSYDSLKRDIEKYSGKEFRFIILDEGQYIKNFLTQKAKAVKMLEGDIKFALTGTPIENSLLDLWSIFDFIMPDYLDTYHAFKDEYNNNSNSDDIDFSKLVKKITPFVLRRTKKTVLNDLPSKFETICYAKMEGEQRKLYEAYLLKAREQIKKTDSRIAILAILTRLRQICVDPNMFIDNYKGNSAKIDLAINIILESINSGHRILGFSQFKSLFPSIIKRLDEENIKYFVITGEVKSEERLKMVEAFNDNKDIKVFLISLKAGGTGLNLTGADIVIHFDPWWNVSAENQATDRAHRIGQTRDVQVVKLICEDSIEQKVLELQQMKSSLTEKVITDGDEKIVHFDEKDIDYLLE